MKSRKVETTSNEPYFMTYLALGHNKWVLVYKHEYNTQFVVGLYYMAAHQMFTKSFLEVSKGDCLAFPLLRRQDNTEQLLTEQFLS